VTDIHFHYFLNGVQAYLLGCLCVAAFFATMGVIFLIVNFVPEPGSKDTDD